MPHLPRDDTFAQYANQVGLARPEQLEHARQVQGARAANGVEISLAEALVQIGAITEAQREDAKTRLAGRHDEQQLGHYRLLSKLGEGAMGRVYVADDTLMRRRVAIKILREEHAEDQRFLARFRREVRAIGKLSHTNIVAAHTVGEESGKHFLVMEYCDGESLDAILTRRRRLPVAEALQTVLQVARGLEHAHQHGLIHRDIKPGNVLVCSDGIAKVLDLGLSKDLSELEHSFSTKTGLALGTPHYLSPEQARGDKQVDARTDIYSLGAMLFHLLTGQPPFRGATPAVVVMEHITKEAPSPRGLCPDLPRPIAQLTLAMMARNPDDRYPSCRELCADLERLLNGQPLLGPAGDLVPTAVLPVEALKRPKRRGAAVVIGAVILAGLLVGVVWLKLGGEHAPSAALPPATGARQVAKALPVSGHGQAGAQEPVPQPERPLPPTPPQEPPLSERTPAVPLARELAPQPEHPAPPAPSEVASPLIAANRGRWVFLSELPETAVKTLDPNDTSNPNARWMYVNFAFAKGAWGREESRRQQIMVNQQPSPHGLAMYPPRANSSAEVSYKLGGQYTRLEGAAGVDDGAFNRGARKSATPLTFIVRGDGKELWKSNPLQRAGESQEFSLSVTGIDKLELVVDCPGASDFGMGVWVEPRVLQSDAMVKK